MTYEDFRTGLTFAEVRLALKLEADQVFRTEGRRMFVTRHTVLGRWRQLKLASWEAYQRDRAKRKDTEGAGGVPALPF